MKKLFIFGDSYSDWCNKDIESHQNGETLKQEDFWFQKLTSPAKKGLTLIWPADWTHLHKGQISQTDTKYILTGWLNYRA